MSRALILFIPPVLLVWAYLLYRLYWLGHLLCQLVAAGGARYLRWRGYEGAEDWEEATQ